MRPIYTANDKAFAQALVALRFPLLGHRPIPHHPTDNTEFDFAPSPRLDDVAAAYLAGTLMVNVRDFLKAEQKINTIVWNNRHRKELV